MSAVDGRSLPSLFFSTVYLGRGERASRRACLAFHPRSLRSRSHLIYPHVSLSFTYMLSRFWALGIIIVSLNMVSGYQSPSGGFSSLGSASPLPVGGQGQAAGVDSDDMHDEFYWLNDDTTCIRPSSPGPLLCALH